MALCHFSNILSRLTERAADFLCAISIWYIDYSDFLLGCAKLITDRVIPISNVIEFPIQIK